MMLAVMAYDAENHESRRFVERSIRRRYRVMEQVILDRVRGCNRVLDVGCGTGRFTIQIAARAVIGLDRSSAMLAIARRRNVDAVLGDGNAVPFRDAAFDAVVATDHVYNWLDQDRTLRECARVLVPGGLLAVHYGTDKVWTPRDPLRLRRKPGASGLPACKLIELAAGHGFALEHVRLWRWLRFYPYLVPTPPVPRLRLWNQGVLVFRKTH